MAYTLPNGKVITSEVLLKLKAEELPGLPIACKVCPAATWQLTGNLDSPGLRCFCRVMHLFSWDSRNPPEEILDCDMIYEPEEEDDETIHDQEDKLPPFLASRRSLLTQDGQEVNTDQDFEGLWPEA
ncbi:hypothetical protein L1K71_22100 [Salmonella enterica subsp. enterica serovar Anatum]|nr:hypothetical protein [Salmonella enterica]MCF1782630.1 hypothetical protein [Salmonella enterica subsp. enterica serovar Anatum]MCF1802085.1 hypothetical protein [Salmonella enterica subsp. enterica serovar Anatum]MCF1806245.1 hypothetical protein [Salmonella enterica subsp. enterica serovar Anatum]MCF1810528.1 hypothetical protein [Salmonella enterica subsp. enterica serovar Anatum]